MNAVTGIVEKRAKWFVKRVGSEAQGRAVSVSSETSTTCTVFCSRSVPGGTG